MRRPRLQPPEAQNRIRHSPPEPIQNPVHPAQKWPPVFVYTDGEQLVTALGNVTDSYIGKRYVVNPIRINAAFHPKLFLLLGQNKAKLYVSSANLTTSGFCINNEIVNEFIYDIDHPENLKQFRTITEKIALFISIMNRLVWRQK